MRADVRSRIQTPLWNLTIITLVFHKDNRPASFRRAAAKRTYFRFWDEVNDSEEMQKQAFCLTMLPGHSRGEKHTRDAQITGRDISQNRLYDVYPLHKIAANVPQIYTRYKQA